MQTTNRIRLEAATKLVRLSAANGYAAQPGIVEGAAVTATRVDGEGNASGTCTLDHMGCGHGVFSEPLAAGLWDITATAE